MCFWFNKYAASFSLSPQGLREKEAATGKFSGLISKSDPPEAFFRELNRY